MSRDLTTFPISQYARFKLLKCGFLTADDLTGFTPNELAKVTELDAEKALEVLEIVFPPSVSNADSFGVSAFDLLKVEKSLNPITTSCSALDAIMRGGIPLKKVTEVCGSPGSGKTQLCMQLCANVLIPKSLGGLEGEALYIDTEGSFMVQRLVQIATGTINQCKAAVKDSDNQSFTVDTILKGIYYYPCKSYLEVIARINLLHKFLEEHKKITLVVLDSIAFHFRYGFEGNYLLRSRLLNGIMQKLIKVANDFNVAILLTNQMTTRINGDGSSQLIPALGESWAHSCAIRIILSWTEEQRRAYILKSPSMAEAEAFFTITRDGFRDAPHFKLK